MLKNIQTKWWAWVILVVLVVLFWQTRQLIKFYNITKDLRTDCLQASSLLSQEKFIESQKVLVTCQASIDNLAQELVWWRFSTFGLLNSTVDGYNNLLTALSTALPDLTKLAQLGEAWQNGTKQGDSDYIFLLKHNQELATLNQSLTNHLALLSKSLEADVWLFSYLRYKTKPYLVSLQNLTAATDKLLPWTGLLGSTVGLTESKTYLIFFQNSTELRPTGGFWGSYGLLKMKSGKIESFVTDDIYHQDVKLIGAKNLPPIAEPLKKYLASDQWYLRDANWSPDFALAAKFAIQLYNKINPEQTIAGVVAVTPNLVEDLLLSLGPITLDGQTFNRENFLTDLEYEVEQGYKQKGVSSWDRKDILNKLMAKFLERLPKSLTDLEGAQKLIPVLEDNLQTKDILFYFVDPVAQSQVEQLNWAGRILPNSADYLLVVDANLASFKTDQFIDRIVNYQVGEAKDKNKQSSLRVKVILKYNHRGNFDWKTTRYRTYTRLYVPLGSKLISATGLVTDDRDKPAQADVYNEAGKTVLAGFISVEPQQGGQLEFVYDLPQFVYDQWQKGSYELLLQKQPGVENKLVEIKVATPKNIKTNSWNLGQADVFSKTASVNGVNLIKDGHLLVNW